MDDIIAGIVKGAAIILRIMVEGGIWELSIKKPGRLILKLLWPPFWFKHVEYDGWLISILGISFWVVVAYFMYYLSLSLETTSS